MKAIQTFIQKPIAKIGAAALAIVIIGIAAWNPLRVLSLQARAGRRLDTYIATHAAAVSRFLACQMPLLADLPADERLAEAVDLLEKAQAYGPFKAHTDYLLGRAYCLAGDYDLAIEAFNAYSSARPENPKGSLEAAFAHFTLAEKVEGLGEAARSDHRAQTVRLLAAEGYTFDYFLTQGRAAFNDEAYPTAWLFYRVAAAFEPLPSDAAQQLSVLSDAFAP